MLHEEPGGDVVLAQLENLILSSVNLAETAGVLIRAGMSEAEAAVRLAGLPIEVVVADAPRALAAAGLIAQTRNRGLSLGDRFCLALARERGLPAMTADRAWAGLELRGIEIELIR